MEYFTTFNETTALIGFASLLFGVFQFLFVQSWVANCIVKFNLLSKNVQYGLVVAYVLWNLLSLVVSVAMIYFYPKETVTFAVWSTLALAPFYKRLMAWTAASFQGYLDQAYLELEVYNMTRSAN